MTIDTAKLREKFQEAARLRPDAPILGADIVLALCDELDQTRVDAANLRHAVKEWEDGHGCCLSRPPNIVADTEHYEQYR